MKNSILRLLGVLSLSIFSLTAQQTTQQKFDQAYWAAQPVEVQQVIPPLLEKLSHDEVSIDAVKDAAFALAKKGYVIYAETMVYGLDPYQCMVLRKGYGYTWYPSLLQPPPALAPGLQIPGQPMYDADHPPAGSVKISTNLEDYHPAVTPAPVVAPPAIPAKPLFTVSQGPGRYSAIPGDTSPDGTVYSGPEGNFTKRVQDSPFGKWSWWEAQ